MTRSLACIFCAMLLAGIALTQSTPSKPAFGMAEIRPSPDVTTGIILNGRRGSPWAGNGRYEIRSATLLDLIVNAYGTPADKVLGGPNWLEWDTFDVNAKFDGEANPEKQKLMLQSLLEDRFKLVLRNETRDLPSYILTAGKSPKLKQSEGGDGACRIQLEGAGVTATGDGGFRLNGGAGPIMMAASCRGMTMEAFARYLVNQVSQNGSTNPVTDQTELKGSWDFDFKTSFQIRALAAVSQQDNVTIFDAVDKQLGLKLTQTKTQLPVMVVASAEKPGPNAPGAEAALAVKHGTEFDVADVKPVEPGGRGMRIQVTRGGGVNFNNLALQMLIDQAYGISDDRLIVPPAFREAMDNRFAIIAKAPGLTSASASPDSPAGNGQANASPDDNEAAWLMMRALLEDRFKLKMHQETRLLTAWKLVAVKPKMKKADPSERTKTTEGPGADGKDPRKATPTRGRLVMFQNVTMAQFADKLEGISSYLQTPVIDATGLDGGYDFTINFSGVGVVNGGPGRGGDGPPAANGETAAVEPNGAISLFEAIEEQLGLKLVEDKRQIPVYVIDHVEAKPTEN